METVSATPVDIIRRMYFAHPDMGSFQLALEGYMRHAYVYAGRDLFVMARLCNHKATSDELDNLFCEWPAEETDCWHVHAAAGDLSRLFEVCPVKLPYARWVNRGRQFIVPFEKAQLLLTRHATETIGG